MVTFTGYTRQVCGLSALSKETTGEHRSTFKGCGFCTPLLMTFAEDPQAITVSIVIPAYNAARFIETALTSACAQTIRSIEILVVDDCSTDETAALVETFRAQDDRVRLLRTPRNGGPSAAYNLGFTAARGEWIAILDADDAYEPERLERLIDLGRSRAADMCADNLLNVYENGKYPPELMIPLDKLSEQRQLTLTEFIEENLDRSRRRTHFGFLKPMIRRTFLQKHSLRFDEALRYSEDFTFDVACLRAGAAWWVSPEPMYRYLIREGSLTQVQTSHDLDRLRRLDRLLLQDPVIAADKRLVRALRKHMTLMDRRYYYRAFTNHLKAGAWGSAVKLLFDSARATPLVVLESMRLAPVVLAARLRRGYDRLV